MALLDSFFHRVLIAPNLHDGARHASAVENLIPADQCFTTTRQVFADALDEPGLQTILVAEVFALNDFLAGFAVAPAVLGHLIAADVDVGRRE